MVAWLIEFLNLGQGTYGRVTSTRLTIHLVSCPVVCTHLMELYYIVQTFKIKELKFGRAIFNSRVSQNLGKKSISSFLSLQPANRDSFWGFKLRRAKGLSLAEMRMLRKSARPCTILYNTPSFICFFLAARVERFGLLHNIQSLHSRLLFSQVFD